MSGTGIKQQGAASEENVMSRQKPAADQEQVLEQQMQSWREFVVLFGGF